MEKSVTSSAAICVGPLCVSTCTSSRREGIICGTVKNVHVDLDVVESTQSAALFGCEPETFREGRSGRIRRRHAQHERSDVSRHPAQGEVSRVETRDDTILDWRKQGQNDL